MLGSAILDSFQLFQVIGGVWSLSRDDDIGLPAELPLVATPKWLPRELRFVCSVDDAPRLRAWAVLLPGYDWSQNKAVLHDASKPPHPLTISNRIADSSFPQLRLCNDLGSCSGSRRPSFTIIQSRVS